MPGKYGIEKSTWNRYDLTDEQGNDIMDRVAALETKVASMTGGDGIFPVGTVLCFADDSISAGKLHTLYGGVWKLYAQGRTLVGAVFDNYNSLGYSSKMAKANTCYDPPGQPYANGYTSTDSASQHDAGTNWSLAPKSGEWYAKMGNDSLVAHSHTGSESSDRTNRHWHRAWTAQSYSGEQAPTGDDIEKHWIYQDWNGNESNKTYKALLQIPAVNHDYTGMQNKTLMTDFSNSPVKITTDSAGSSDPKLGTWQPYITVWFYKRIE